MIQVKRAYASPSSTDGTRILAERLWPRGLSKENLRIDEWLKDVAPSSQLRKWFNHDPDRWPEFQRRYFAELDARPDAWMHILDVAKKGRVTLIFSSRDAEHNNVVALNSYLESKSKIQ